MKVFFGSDHAGFDLKQELISFVEGLGFSVHDEGPFEKVLGDDYPDYAFKVARSVSSTPDSRGVIIGGSGQGEAMAANRLRGVRAAVFYADTGAQQTDASGRALSMIESSREHNDANVLALGARFLTESEAKRALRLWLEHSFSGDARHLRRIEKLDGENLS